MDSRLIYNINPKILIQQNLKKQLACNSYSDNSFDKHLNTQHLNPWWITGFCDAESSFTVSISKSPSTKIG